MAKKNRQQPGPKGDPAVAARMREILDRKKEAQRSSGPHTRPAIIHEMKDGRRGSACIVIGC